MQGHQICRVIRYADKGSLAPDVLGSSVLGMDLCIYGTSEQASARLS